MNIIYIKYIITYRYTVCTTYCTCFYHKCLLLSLQLYCVLNTSPSVYFIFSASCKLFNSCIKLQFLFAAPAGWSYSSFKQFFKNTLILSNLSVKAVIIQHWTCMAICSEEILIFITWYITMEILPNSSKYKLFYESAKVCECTLRRILGNTSFPSPSSGFILELEGPKDNFTS